MLEIITFPLAIMAFTEKQVTQAPKIGIMLTSSHCQGRGDTITEYHGFVSHPCLVCYDIFYGEA